MIRSIPFLKGAFTPLVVPFRNGEVDFDRYAVLIEWQIGQGTHGLLVNATSGEPTTLTFEEKARLIEVAVKTSGGRKPVVAGIPAESHAEALDLLGRAERAGADAVVSVTPYYVRPPQRGLVAYFADLANRTELPFLIYHIPARAAVSVVAETFESIAERAPNFVGLKNTDDDLALVSRLMNRLGPNFRIFGGLESTAFAMSALGGCGTMLTTSNVVPRQIARLNELCMAGKLHESQALVIELDELMKAPFLDTGPIPIKCMMKLMGLIPTNEHRLPMVPATPELEKQLEAIVARNRLAATAKEAAASEGLQTRARMKSVNP
jgi:4-hydroxy-tetrahydrodipicolinate synthase